MNFRFEQRLRDAQAILCSVTSNYFISRALDVGKAMRGFPYSLDEFPNSVHRDLLGVVDGNSGWQDLCNALARRRKPTPTACLKRKTIHTLTSFLSRIGARKVAKQMPRVVGVGKRPAYAPTVPPVSSSAELVASSTDPSSSALITFMVLRRWSSSASAAASASR